MHQLKLPAGGHPVSVKRERGLSITENEKRENPKPEGLGVKIISPITPVFFWKIISLPIRLYDESANP
jgi:hypothetical protein